MIHVPEWVYELVEAVLVFMNSLTLADSLVLMLAEHDRRARDGAHS